MRKPMKGVHKMSFYQDRFITLNGKSSQDLFYITDKKEQLLSKSINTEAIPNSYGEKVKSIKYNSKLIKYSILFTMEQLVSEKILNINDLKRLIANYFDSNEPVKLWDSKDPNVYCNVLFQGTSDITFLGNNTATTEIELLIPNGLHYSVVEKEIIPKVNEAGILEAVIDSQGTALSDFRLEATMNADNGYFSVVSENGVMEFGKRDEADGVIAEKSIVLASNPKGNFADWVNGTTFYQDLDKKVVTTMTADTQFGGRLGILPASFSNTTNSRFFGAVKEKVLAESAEHWYLWAQAWFETGLMGQTGMWTLSVLDENNKEIASQIIRKADTRGNTAQVYFSINGKIVETINFSPTYWVKNNPYGSESRMQGRNPFDIRKSGNHVRFFWYGKYHDFTESDASFSTMKAKKIQFFTGQFSGRNTNNQKVTHMYLNNLSFRKDKVPYMKDLPNRFSKNDVLVLDTKTKTPTVNNLPRFSDQLKGTHYFQLPKGESKIQFYYSDFSTPIPAVKLYLREAFN